MWVGRLLAKLFEMHLKILLLLLAGCVVQPLEAKVYKWVMPDGSIEYSDRPQEEGARAVELPPLQTYSAPPIPPAGGSAPADGEPEAKGYEALEVVQPKPDETLRDTGGTISVQIRLEPALQRDHTVEILFDGQSIGSGRATAASITNVDRGSHTVSAVVKDADGKELARADDVTFFLKKTSKLLPARPQPLRRPSNPASQSRGGAS